MADNTSDSDNLPRASIQARRLLDDAKLLLQNGDFGAAQDVCRELLAEHTEYVAALSTFGRAYMAEGKYDSALPCFVRASMLEPDKPSILVPLGEVYSRLHGDDMAVLTLERALALGPDKADAVTAYRLLGGICERGCDYERAAEWLEKALAIDAADGMTAHLLGVCYEETGAYDKAVKAYKQALKCDISPVDRALVQYCIARVSASKTGKKFFAGLEKLKVKAGEVGDEADSAFLAAHVYAARALVLDRSGKHEEAWQWLQQANAPLNDLYANDHRMSVETNAASLERARNWSFSGPVSVSGLTVVPVSLFILGPSRSGKTTLERLVGELDGVRHGHESEIVHDSTAQTSMTADMLALEYPGQLPTALNQNFLQNYADEVVKRSRGAKLFTNTHPGSILDLGRIAETVPNARFVFVDRDVDDTALRIFCTIYQRGTNHYAYHPNNIYEFLTGYSLLADTWMEVLSGISVRVSFEDMVADPKKTLQQVADLCGLPAPKGKLSDVGDDRGCSKPYLDLMKQPVSRQHAFSVTPAG